MAGDWIKMRVDLYRDPKVSAMADVLMHHDGDLARYVSQNTMCDMNVTRNVMRNVTVGALLSVWGVMRSRGKRVNDDLVCRGVTHLVVDDIADLQGFGAAMIHAGWVQEIEEGIVFPRFFEEHNTDPADSIKQKNAERQRRYREKNNKSNVTNDVTSNVTHNVTVTPREEKRREEKSIKDNVELKPDNSPATIPDSHHVIDYLNAKAGKRFQHTPSHCKYINARIKEGRTAQDLIAVIDRKCAEWIGDPNMEQYLRPQTLFNSEKFDGYLSEIDKPLAAPKPSRFIPDHNDTSWADGFNPYSEVL